MHVRFQVMKWSSDVLDPLRISLRMCASDSISVPCVECTRSWLRLLLPWENRWLAAANHAASPWLDAHWLCWCSHCHVFWPLAIDHGLGPCAQVLTCHGSFTRVFDFLHARNRFTETRLRVDCCMHVGKSSCFASCYAARPKQTLKYKVWIEFCKGYGLRMDWLGARVESNPLWPAANPKLKCKGKVYVYHSVERDPFWLASHPKLTCKGKVYEYHGVERDLLWLATRTKLI